MEIKGWKYYNHSAVPTGAVHTEPDTTPIENGDIWKISGRTPMLARWTTDFDCGFETNWWYVIKSDPFDINALKSKRRYVINRGKKFFDVKLIKPSEYIDELYEVQKESFTAYPEKYRPSVSYESFVETAKEWDKYIVYGAFYKENGKLCGYNLLNKHDNAMYFSAQSTIPEYEKYEVNAVLVAAFLEDEKEFLEQGGYICDGMRSINHETQFQDYLEKYFGFRKAYCSLHIVYNPKITWAVKFLYPFRKIFELLNGNKLFHQVHVILKMEEVKRGKV